ncbi:5368_t:CDS:2, partial [Ambispora leptoticha]
KRKNAQKFLNRNSEEKIKANIIAENEGVIAILDINPASDGHTLLITKEHFANISEYEGDKGFIWTAKPELKYNLEQV